MSDTNVDSCIVYTNLIALKIIIAAILCLEFIFMLYYARLFIMRRALYPIKERSPIITALALLCYFMANCRNSLRSTISLFDSSEEQKTHFSLNLLGTYAVFSFMSLNLIKVGRMIYVIKCDKHNPKVRDILKSEFQLISIGLSLSALLTFAIYVPPLFGRIDIDDETDWYNDVLMLLLPFSQILYMSAAYLLRELQTEYSISFENMLLAITMFIFSIFIFIEEVTEDCNWEYCLIFLAWIFFMIYTWATMISPLSKSRVYHKTLHNHLILENFEDFIMNYHCLLSFRKYLTNNNRPTVFGTTLKYYCDVRKELELNTQEISHDFAKEMIEFVRQNEELLEYFQKNESVIDLQDVHIQDADYFSQRERDIASVRFFYERAFYLLEGQYLAFRDTVAFREIRRQLIINERIDRNLFLLNMTLSSFL